MSTRDTPRDGGRSDGRRSDVGDTTAKKGTARPVHMAASRRGRSSIAMFLAGPVIWSVHFLVVYLTVEAGCTGDGEGLDVFDPPVPSTVTIVATVGAALACLVAAALALRRWRADRLEQTARTDVAPAEGVASLAFAGFLLSLLGFVTVLFVGVPVWFLPACLP